MGALDSVGSGRASPRARSNSWASCASKRSGFPPRMLRMSTEAAQFVTSSLLYPCCWKCRGIPPFLNNDTCEPQILQQTSKGFSGTGASASHSCCVIAFAALLGRPPGCLRCGRADGAGTTSGGAVGLGCCSEAAAAAAAAGAEQGIAATTSGGAVGLGCCSEAAAAAAAAATAEWGIVVAVMPLSQMGPENDGGGESAAVAAGDAAGAAVGLGAGAMRSWVVAGLASLSSLATSFVALPLFQIFITWPISSCPSSVWVPHPRPRPRPHTGHPRPRPRPHPRPRAAGAGEGIVVAAAAAAGAAAAAASPRRRSSIHVSHSASPSRNAEAS